MTQKQALTSGLRTAEQTLEASLGVIIGGGAVLGATSLASINWETLGGALAFALLASFFAGLKSYLSFVVNGVPAAYTTLPDVFIDGSHVVPVAPTPTVIPDPTPPSGN